MEQNAPTATRCPPRGPWQSRTSRTATTVLMTLWPIRCLREWMPCPGLSRPKTARSRLCKCPAQPLQWCGTILSCLQVVFEYILLGWSKSLVIVPEIWKSLCHEKSHMACRYVGGLSPEVEDQDLRDHFYPYGEVSSIKVKMKPCSILGPLLCHFAPFHRPLCASTCTTDMYGCGCCRSWRRGTVRL